MSFSGGVFSLVAGNPVVTGTTISSTVQNNTLSDIATGLSTCILKDGSQTITANIPMSSFKLTGLAAGSASGDSLRYEQVFTTGTLTLLGPVNIAAATAGQIVFPASQNAASNANTLDDYEEGTWTPTLTFATAGDLNVVYSTQAGFYTKIGRMVNLSCEIITSTFTHTTASGNLEVTGLPFTSLSTSGANSYGALLWQGITKANYTNVVSQLANNSAIMIFAASGSAQSASTISTADTPTGGTVRIAFSHTHYTA